jgi:hypothetical protein
MIIQKSSFYSEVAARQRSGAAMATDNRGNRVAAPGYLQARMFIVSGFRRMMPLVVEKLVAGS